MDTVKESHLFTKGASAWFRGLATVMVILSHYGEWWAWFQVEEGNRELFRYALSRMGPYGVGIFLLFSGYGLARSAGGQRIGLPFVVKRILGVYIPYLIMVVLIEILSGGFKNPETFLKILYGSDFWYMTVLFLLYLGFMAIWFVVKNPHLRLLFLCLFLYFCNTTMQEDGKQYFWYISNWSFGIGAALALYEKQIGGIIKKIGILLALNFGTLTFRVIYSGLYVEQVFATSKEEDLCRMGAVIIFILFIAFLAAVWKWYDPVLQLVGKCSLYFYLSHTFLFMQVINRTGDTGVTGFALATVVIVAISLLLGIGMEAFLNRIIKPWVLSHQTCKKE